MKGIYTAKRAKGTAVCISYSPPGEQRVREVIELVPHGRKFTKRLREAEKRAEKVLIKRKASVVEGKHQLVRPGGSITLLRFVEGYYADELRERGLRTAEKEIQRLTTGPVGRLLGDVRLSDMTEWRIIASHSRSASTSRAASTASTPPLSLPNRNLAAT